MDVKRADGRNSVIPSLLRVGSVNAAPTRLRGGRPFPPFAKDAKDGAPHAIGDTGISEPGPPARGF